MSPTDQAESMINFEGVDKAYGNEKVLGALDFSVSRGSFTVLLGPSGCGKTTILRLIAGLEKPDRGVIRIAGKSMDRIAPGDRDIAMVFQNYALYPTMTVYQNIEFGLKNHGIAKPDRAKKIREIAETVGLSDYLGKKPQFLSGGQRQRVALARAMVKKPSIFLMDEPLSNLDASLRSQIRTELAELYRSVGTTFVYVTHDQIEALSLGTQVILMEKGAIRQAAKPEILYSTPSNLFSARFIGSPPMNVLDAKLALGEKYLNLGPGIDQIGFRPERASLHQAPPEGAQGQLTIYGDLGCRELLGSETLYTVHSWAGDFKVKQAGFSELPYGPVFAKVGLGDLCLFDSKGDCLGVAAGRG